MSLLQGVNQSNVFGVDYHPTVSQHYKNALELTNYIKQIKGWPIDTTALNTATINAK